MHLLEIPEIGFKGLGRTTTPGASPYGGMWFGCHYALCPSPQLSQSASLIRKELEITRTHATGPRHHIHLHANWAVGFNS
jgi:hypothetical protein